VLPTPANSNPATPTPATAPYYQQLIAALLHSDAVLPPQLPVHPVAAMSNREAVIPPQCYTRTEGRFNPCYVCHQDARDGRENVMNDGDLQAAYSFSDAGMTNHWRNLFSDRTAAVAAISDAAIDQWIAQDNYSELPQRLRDANFQGWIPDLAGLQEGPAAFTRDGFAKDGSQWVTFNYKPFPSTFWPTNGSTDDVMIRLAPRFQRNSQGQYSQDVYKANLAILEANIKGLPEISTWPIDERNVDVDLNGDGALTVTRQITVLDRYVGMAASDYLDTHLYPAETEFLHTVRYVGIDADGQVYNPRRIKEVRYMKKWRIYPKPVLERFYILESYEKHAGNLPGYQNLLDSGLDNGMGWAIQSFIENKNGRLRVSTHEENFFCMGCHNSIGSTIEKTFSFARKVEGAAGWGYIRLQGMADAPTVGEQEGEIATYLRRVGGGSEFRDNPEMLARWFDNNGRVDPAKLATAREKKNLIVPSAGRARTLNKAYRTLVAEQSFIFGRDARVHPPANVYEYIDNLTAPTLPAAAIYEWDIRLDWKPAP
jgi:hypothetical protein